MADPARPAAAGVPCPRCGSCRRRVLYTRGGPNCVRRHCACAECGRRYRTVERPAGLGPGPGKSAY